MSKIGFILRSLKKAGYFGKITGFSECSGCGLCCLRNSCACSPADFRIITPRSVEELLNSKKFMITAAYKQCINNNTMNVDVIPVISAREINTPKNGINISMLRSSCALLTDEGCSLSVLERPSQGILLIPFGCKCKCFMGSLTELWEPYKNILVKVIKRRTGKSVDVLFKENTISLGKILKDKLYDGEPLSTNEYMAAFEMDYLGLFTYMFGEFDGITINELIHDVPIKFD